MNANYLGTIIWQNVSKFLGLKSRQRKQRVKEFRLCFRCLGEHNFAQCTSGWSCYKCKSTKHHNLIHFDLPQSAATSVGSGVDLVGTPNADTGRSNIPGYNRAAIQNACQRTTVLLATAVVHVLDICGECQEFRSEIVTLTGLGVECRLVTAGEG